MLTEALLKIDISESVRQERLRNINRLIQERLLAKEGGAREAHDAKIKIVDGKLEVFSITGDRLRNVLNDYELILDRIFVTEEERRDGYGQGNVTLGTTTTYGGKPLSDWMKLMALYMDILSDKTGLSKTTKFTLQEVYRFLVCSPFIWRCLILISLLPYILPSLPSA